MAIDYARATNEQDLIQRAADAAVLAGASRRQDTTDTNEIETAAADVFNINYEPTGDATINPPTFSYSPVTQEIVATVTGTVPTTLTRVLGFQTIDIAANATAQTTIQRVEYVLAIDQSGSMLGERQATLVASLQEFRQTLQNTLGFDDAAALGIIPWQTSVNIGPDRRDWVLGLDRPINEGFTPPLFLGANEGDPNNLIFTPQTQPENVIQALSSYDFAQQGYGAPNINTGQQDFINLIGGIPNANPQQTIDPSQYPDLSWRGCILERDTSNTVDVSPPLAIGDFVDTVGSSALAAPVTILRTPSNDNDRFRVFYQPPEWGQATRVNTWTPFGNDTEASNINTRNPNIGCIRQEMQYFFDLTDISDTSQLSAAINALNPEDDAGSHTDTSLGMIWALRMLDPDWHTFWDPAGTVDAPGPFNNPSAVRKVIILLTDGRNGISTNTRPQSFSSYGDTSQTLDPSLDNNTGPAVNRSTEVLNLRTLRFCQLAKDLEAEVYTIAFDIDPSDSNNADVIDTLENCASEPNASVSQYAHIATNANLNTLFDAIARQSTQVNLTQ